MKPISLTAKYTIVLIVGVVLLVFLGTYASITIGGGGKPPPPPPPIEQIVNFEKTVVDREGDPDHREEQELHQPSYYDFWFSVEQEPPVELYWLGQACKCSHVEVCAVPQELKDLSKDKRAERLEQEKPAWTRLDKESPRGKIRGKAGVVRLNWKGEQQGPQRLWVELKPISSQGRSAETARLEVALTFVHPIQVVLEGTDPESATAANEVQIGTLLPGDSRTANVLLLSGTRDRFTPTGQPAEDGCLSLGKPTPLDEKELGELGQKYSGKFRSGYRVTVTIRERGADGKQLDLGQFRRHARWDTDVTAGPVEALVRGTVIGEVSFKDPVEGRDILNLGGFAANQGMKKVMTGSTEQNNLDLEVESFPDFMDRPELRAEKSLVGRTWELEVVVPPNRLNGPVPRDSAIVLKVKDSPRRVRIPVAGNGFSR